MNLTNLFQTTINHKQLFSKNDQLLVAVSGGVDSVVLCDLLQKTGYNFVIAHCNFQLRGDESDRDEEFVRSLSAKYQKEFRIARFDAQQYSDDKQVSIQVAARELRYNWFRILLEELRTPGSAGWILTAHHADDNIETVTMNFFRGTGIQGLRGIKPRHEDIVRPLLFFRKQDLVTYASEHNLEWVTDSSNLSVKYTRNNFRNLLIPAIAEIFPQVEQNLLNNIRRFTEVEMIYNDWIGRVQKDLLVTVKNEVHIPVLKLKKLIALETVLHELVVPYGFTSSQVHEIIALLDSPTGKYISSSTHRIIRNRRWLVIAPKADAEAINMLVEHESEEVMLSDGKLTFSVMSDGKQELDLGNSAALLDATEARFPLIVRRWKQGDYFYPLGMVKKKKVARFLIDQKLSKTDKEKVNVILSGNRIIWIVGMRIDERFKIRASTKKILRIDFHQNA